MKRCFINKIYSQFISWQVFPHYCLNISCTFCVWIIYTLVYSWNTFHRAQVSLIFIQQRFFFIKGTVSFIRNSYLTSNKKQGWLLQSNAAFVLCKYVFKLSKNTCERCCCLVSNIQYRSWGLWLRRRHLFLHFLKFKWTIGKKTPVYP